jgi:flagellar motility protein MotE (MotC chaperone)
MSLKFLRCFKIYVEDVERRFVHFFVERSVGMASLSTILSLLCMVLVFCKIMMFGHGNEAIAQEKDAGQSGMKASKPATGEAPPSVPEKKSDQDKGKADADAKVANKPTDNKPKDGVNDNKADPEKKSDAQDQKKKINAEDQGPNDKIAKQDDKKEVGSKEESSQTELSKAAFNPMTLTSNEIKVLETLSERRREIEEKDRKIGLRMALVQASEQRMDQKIEVLQNLRSAIESLLKKYDSQEKENFRALAKIYEKMKPKEAARIFSELDMPILLNVITYIKDVKASQIISYMDTKRARDLTLALAKERQKKDEAQQKLDDVKAGDKTGQAQ